MANLLGEFSRFPKLAELPGLVRQQRKLAARLVDAKGNKLVDLEKAVRAQIDPLLLACGFTTGEGVLCNGYQVVHRERLGNLSLNEDKAVEQFVALGLEAAQIRKILADCAERGATATFCEVNPAPGAKVRRPAA